LSSASAWEILIKSQIGKLELKQNPCDFIAQQMQINHFSPLPLEMAHVFALYSLTLHHRDPFNRILAAQCVAEKMPLITIDPALKNYPIEILW
jgi:PIN domain nuclease of toxin-antitoxin system